LSDSELTDGPLHGSTAARHKRRDSLTATIGKSHSLICLYLLQ
jgi:hypothetical protein